MARAQVDMLEVIMVHQITGDRYVDTGRKAADGSTIHDRTQWPAPGQRIRLPRDEALSLIHNELAYPAKGGLPRSNDAIEAAIASQDAAV